MCSKCLPDPWALCLTRQACSGAQVLYTDVDTIFMEDINSCSLPSPRILSAAGEVNPLLSCSYQRSHMVEGKGPLHCLLVWAPTLQNMHDTFVLNSCAAVGNGCTRGCTPVLSGMVCLTDRSGTQESK